MLTRLTGTLESIDDALTITVGPLALRVEAPRYLLDRLTDAGAINQAITLHTRLDLESHNQGTSFSPRLVAFATPDEREFFDLFTSVKGLGTRRALRALAKEPSHIAAAIVAKDARTLQQLPEIGKRLAETVIAELSGKVDRFATELAIQDLGLPPRAAIIEPRRPTMPPAAEEALAALMALGDARPDAERKVQLALSKAGPNADANQLVSAVFGS
jgi:Holliday junction DNA helicase RuvA